MLSDKGSGKGGRVNGEKVDLRVGSSKSTRLPSGVESVCSSVTVEIFWRRRSMYKSLPPFGTVYVVPTAYRRFTVHRL